MRDSRVVPFRPRRRRRFKVRCSWCEASMWTRPMSRQPNPTQDFFCSYACKRACAAADLLQ